MVIKLSDDLLSGAADLPVIGDNYTVVNVHLSDGRNIPGVILRQSGELMLNEEFVPVGVEVVNIS